MVLLRIITSQRLRKDRTVINKMCQFQFLSKSSKTEIMYVNMI